MNEKSDIGFIYILSNPAMPGFIKIGFTCQDPNARASELSKQTSVPLPFILEMEQITENPSQYERLIHAKLSKYRVLKEKEFFKIDVGTAVKVIYKVIFGEESLDILRSAEHLLFLYKKYPEHFTKNDGLASKIEELIKT